MTSQAAASLRDSVLQKLSELDEALEGIGEAKANEPPAEGEWCCKEVMSHLMSKEGQPLTGESRRFVEEDTPLIPIEPGISYMTPQREAMSLSQMRESVMQQYRSMADWLGGLSDEQLARKAQVPLFKETPLGEYPTLGQFTAGLMNFHFADHINQIRTARG